MPGHSGDDLLGRQAQRHGNRLQPATCAGAKATRGLLYARGTQVLDLSGPDRLCGWRERTSLVCRVSDRKGMADVTRPKSVVPLNACSRSRTAYRTSVPRMHRVRRVVSGCVACPDNNHAVPLHKEPARRAIAMSRIAGHAGECRGTQQDAGPAEEYS